MSFTQLFVAAGMGCLVDRSCIPVVVVVNIFERLLYQYQLLRKQLAITSTEREGERAKYYELLIFIFYLCFEKNQINARKRSPTELYFVLELKKC